MTVTRAIAKAKAPAEASRPGSTRISLRPPPLTRSGPLHAAGPALPLVQPKLAVGPVDDEHEREADAVAETVMRMPDAALPAPTDDAPPDLIQTQRAGSNGAATSRAAAPTSVPSARLAPPGPGEPLPSAVRRRVEPALGADLSHVRVHDSPSAQRAARSLQARAFAHRHHIWLGRGESPRDLRLMAHEATHVVQQQRLGPAVQRQGNDADPLTRLRHLLDDDQEEGAIALMGTLDEDQARAVLSSASFQELAVDAFGNEEMYRAMMALQGDLYDSLRWMFDEGTSWSYVRAVIPSAPSGHRRVRESGWMKVQFVDLCNDAEMVAAVNLLGGTLRWRLSWMFAEGVGSWSRIRDQITARGVSDAEKRAVLNSPEIRAYFVSALDDDEMIEAVNLLGGTLLQRLRWMKAEGVDSWSAVRAQLARRGLSEDEKREVRASSEIRGYLVDEFGDDEMADAVRLLGGTLTWKLSWMVAEGTNASLVYNTIRRAPTAELAPVTRNQTVMDGLRDELSSAAFARVGQMLREGLLHWEEVEHDSSEQHYERETATSPWELETFSWTTAYEIEYTRTQLRITVRIKLTGEATTAALRTTWLNGIRNRWNGYFHIDNDRRLDVVFNPVFTSNGPHNTVEVHTGAGRENSTNWHLTTTGDTAAHEFGHMIGLEDEYRLTTADYQRLVGTPPAGPEPPGGHTAPDPIMVSGAGNAQRRHLRPFVAWLNRHRLPGERPYRLVAGP